MILINKDCLCGTNTGLRRKLNLHLKLMKEERNGRQNRGMVCHVLSNKNIHIYGIKELNHRD